MKQFLVRISFPPNRLPASHPASRPVRQNGHSRAVLLLTFLVLCWGGWSQGPAIAQTTPTVTLTSSLNPAGLGTSVTFTATVAAVMPATGTPTGTVTFLDGTTTLGTGTLTNGQTTFTSTTLAVGSQSITASYSGDANFNAVTSSALIEVVVNDTIALTSSSNPDAPTTPLTLTATITPIPPTTGEPTGTVTFLSGSTSLGTGTVTNGVATLTTSLVAGLYLITASYSGDTNFSALVTPVFLQQMAPTGSPFAWGYNGNGELGDNSTSESPIPVLMNGTLTVAAIAGGEYHSLGLTNDGVYATGYNAFGQLGNNSLTQKEVPGKVTKTNGTGYLTGAVAIAAGAEHSLALINDGTLRSWGDNSNGQLGNGTKTNSKVPVQVSGLTGLTVTDIAAGGFHSLAVTSTGAVWSWGFNSDGQLGNGTATDSSSPVQVSGIGGVYGAVSVAVAGGGLHSLALTNAGAVWSWGWNNYGQLGINSTTESEVPVQVEDSTGTTFLTGVTAIAAGEWHSLALTSTGAVWAWGYNGNGELGNGTTTNSSLPVQVPNAPTGVIAIAAGAHFSLALTSAGTIWAWGYNADGELGNNSLVNSTVPVQVTNLTGAVGIGAGYLHGLAIGPTLPTPTVRVTSSTNPSVYGQPITITVTVAATKPAVGTPTGTVKITDGGATIGTYTLSNGVYALTVTPSTPGYQDITAKYSGDNSFLTTTGTVPQNVDQGNTKTVLTSTPNPSVVGQSVTFTAAVTAVAPAAGIPTGTVTFMDGTTTLGSGTMTGGAATFALPFPTATAQSISATYNGDGNFNSSTSSTFVQRVSQGTTAVAVTSLPNPVSPGQAVTLTAAVSAVAPSFSDTGLTSTGVTTPASADNWFVGGTYNAAPFYLSASTSLYAWNNGSGWTISIAVGTNGGAYWMTAAGATVLGPYTAQGTANGMPTVTWQGYPTGSVTFTNGSTTLGSATLTGGTASITATFAAYGTYTITAAYSGGSNFASSSTTYAPPMSQGATSVAFTTSPNPSAAGQIVTFTAAVSATSPAIGTPTGSVTFTNGATSLGTAALDPTGATTLRISTLAAGVTVVTATYSGDTSFLTSTTNAIQRVNTGSTSVSVSSSSNPAVSGSSVTYTAVVTAVAPASGTPTGTVTFSDSLYGVVSTLASGVPLVNGQASLPYILSAIGGHSITATYSGDTNYTTSASNPLIQTITLANSSTTVSSSVNPVASGQSVTFTATVTAAAPAAGTPTGTVTFLDGTTTLGAQPLSNGQAALSTSALSIGSHAITVTYSGDSYFVGSTSSPLTQVVADLWQALDISAGADNSSRILWTNTDGRITTWNVDPSGNQTAGPVYGPYAGWTAYHIAAGLDGLTRVLWTYTDGTASIWHMDDTGNYLSYNLYGPYPGWSPVGLSVAPDYTEHVLWQNTSGAVSIWHLTPGDAPVYAIYGPYPGWAPVGISVAPDESDHVLWQYTDNTMSIWHVTDLGAPAYTLWGPYGSWTPASIGVDTNSTDHILWKYPDGSISRWTVDSGNNMAYSIFGPFTGWNAVALAVAPDNSDHILWNYLDHNISRWRLDSTGTLTYALLGTPTP